MDSPQFFADNLEKIELPTQLVAILADPLLQKLLLLRPDAEGFSRVTNWLKSCLCDFESGDAEPGLLLDMLELTHEYAINTKVCNCIPLCTPTMFSDRTDRHCLRYS